MIAAALLLLASTATAGKSVAVVVQPKDSPSGQAAVIVGKQARDQYWDGYDLLDIERFLMAGEESASDAKGKAGRAALERGKVALDALELAPALEALSEAVVSFEQAAPAMTNASPLVEAHLYEGAAWALQGDQKNAKKSFERALVVDPQAELPAGSFPAQVEKVWAEVKVKAQQGGVGTLTVYATPAAAEVWVDGRFRGAAPVVLDDMAVGRHVVRVWREGYSGFGTVTEVKKSVEASVQATLRPTTRFPQYDELAARLSGGANTAADLAQLLKVDQLFSAVVETKGEQVTVNARLTDGVSGKELVTASKAFDLKSPTLDREVKAWIATTFQSAAPTLATTPTTPSNSDKDSFLPGERKVDTPAALTWGWVLVGTSAVPAVAGLVLGIYSVYSYRVFKLDVPNQVDPRLDDVRSVWAITAGAADVCGAIFVGMLAGGIALVVVGSNEKQELEDVLASVRAAPQPAIVAAGSSE